MRKICPVCHESFEVKSTRRIYCSVRCRKLHHKEVYYDRERPIPIYEVGDKVLRTFVCRKCGLLVMVTSKTDKRTKFCSPHCERLYWKHPEKYRKEEEKFKQSQTKDKEIVK